MVDNAIERQRVNVPDQALFQGSRNFLHSNVMSNASLVDLLSILLRRKWVFLAALGVGLISALIFTLTWDSYSSTAVVQIQQSDIPSNMTNPLGMSQAEVMKALADQRIQQIQQRITSTSNLIEVITKYDLYAKSRQTKPISVIVEEMRKKIKLELLSSSLANPGAAQSMKPDQLSAIAFTLKFSNSNPLKAQQVTNELMTRFLDEDLKQRRNQAQETTSFLDTQLKSLEASMAEQEKNIADFRTQHPDSRPEALALNQQLMATTYQNILAVESQMSGIDKTRGDIRVQMASVDPYSRSVADGQLMTTPATQLKSLQGKYAAIVSQYSPDHPDVVRLRHQIESLQKELGQTSDTAQLQSQLDDARTNLTAATANYGPDHPDVQALRKHVSDLENQLANQARSPSPSSQIKKDADNPAYLMLNSQLQATEEQYKALVAQRASLQGQYQRYQMNVAQTPILEQQYATLSRDYENAQLRYRELKEKMLSADMNEQAEKGRVAERLQVIDSPELPTDTSPKRLFVLAAGIVLSIFCGLAAVSICEMVSLSIHGRRHFISLTGMAPLVVIPHIYTLEERTALHRRQKQFGGTLLGALIVGSFAVHQFVMPLDVLKQVILHRLGIY